VAYANSSDRNKAKPGFYEVVVKDKQDKTVMENGKQKKQVVQKGGWEDYSDFDTLSEFTNAAAGGKNIQVALFFITLASASDPAGWQDPHIIPNKAFTQHAWVPSGDYSTSFIRLYRSSSCYHFPPGNTTSRSACTQGINSLQYGVKFSSTSLSNLSCLSTLRGLGLPT
jgi:hypothetical protein